jgi:hypothetical protein
MMESVSNDIWWDFILPFIDEKGVWAIYEAFPPLRALIDSYDESPNEEIPRFLDTITVPQSMGRCVRPGLEWVRGPRRIVCTSIDINCNEVAKGRWRIRLEHKRMYFEIYCLVVDASEIRSEIQDCVGWAKYGQDRHHVLGRRSGDVFNIFSAEGVHPDTVFVIEYAFADGDDAVSVYCRDKQADLEHTMIYVDLFALIDSESVVEVPELVTSFRL